MVRDDSKFIYASIASLEEHLIFGSLFAAVVVMFFIRNLRAVLISALAIPASIISTFTLMDLMGFTLNNMTLLGITLAVGIVIDDAIVVLENIFRYIEEKNCTPFDAAIQGTREVALAVMATTLSLVVIFLPIAFMNGYAKRFINPFGWTMAFSIMVSMLVSFTLTPMLSSRILKLSDARRRSQDARRKASSTGSTPATSGRCNWALDHSGVIIAISLVAFLMTFPLNKMVGREFAPDEDLGEWTIHMDAPEGTSLEGSQEMAFKLLKEIQGIPGVADIEPLVNPGGSGVTGGGGGSNVTHVHFNVQALPLDERKQTQAQMIAEMRKRLLKYPGVPAEHHRAQRAGQRRGRRRLRDLAEHPRPRSPAAVRLLAEDAGGGAEDAEPRRAEAEPQRLESRDSRRGRSAARRRPRRPDVDHRQHAATRGLGRRSDLVLQGRAGTVPGQGPRPREPAPRRQGDRPADGAVADRAGAHRQHRAHRSRARAERAAALEPAVHGAC